jgi:hypothetical protein
MPVLVGVIAVLFQFGILFISFLSIVHSTRDIGRWLAVHPDTIDSAVTTYVQTNAPTVIDPTKLSVAVTPSCSATPCSARTSGSALHLTLTYNAASSFFLPTTWRFGPFFDVVLPTTLPPYDYYVMVENH